MILQDDAASQKCVPRTNVEYCTSNVLHTKLDSDEKNGIDFSFIIHHTRAGPGRKFHGSGRAGFFPFRTGRVGSGHHKFSGLVGSEFLSLGSKSGQVLGSKNAIFKVKNAIFFSVQGKIVHILVHSSYFRKITQ